MRWTQVKVATPPTSLPIVLSDIKPRLRVLHDDDDALITDLIGAAVAQIDGPGGIGVAMMAQEWTLTSDRFEPQFSLPGWPVKSVVSVNYLDTDGASQSMDLADVRLDTGHEPARLVPAFGATWPIARDVVGAVQITYALGVADAADVDRGLVAAVSLLTAHLYRHREAVMGAESVPLPLGVESLLSRHRRGVVSA